jgi:hypothetical protein
MSVRNAIALLFAVSTIIFLAACGGSSSNSAAPPPSGAYSKSNLNGTYIFSSIGLDINGSPLTLVGSFSANGSGVISGGAVDVLDLGAGISADQSISGGNYTVTSDGRGQATLNVNTVLGSTIGLDFVLTSNSHGLVTEFDNTGTGSGTLDLQSTSVTQSGLGSYAFSLSGWDTSGNAFGTVGNLALNSTGTITAGLQDINDNKNPLTNLVLTGSVLLGAAGAPGQAVLTAAGSPYGTQFDVWPIDSTHFKLIETDGLVYISGDAFTQQSTISAGQLVYTMGGIDSSSSLLSEGGFMTYDGTSVISGGLEDINDGGTIAQSLTVSGTLTAVGTARYQLVLGSFYNGVSGATGSYTFTGYPSSSGILLLETDNLGISGGTAFAQSATTFASGQGYGLNLTGANAGGEVDDIAEFTANSGGTLSDGLIDENEEGTLAFDQKLGSGGTYTFDSPATGRGVLTYPATDTTYIGTLNLAFYVANSSTVIFIDGDGGAQAGVGVFELQSSSASAAIAHTVSHFASLRASAQRAAKKK